MDSDDEDVQVVPRVGIACQGGGSHTAFCAGVLKRLLRENDREYQIKGMSGTSGGAICAALAWYGLIKHDNQLGEKLLDSFWREMAAGNLFDSFLNTITVWSSRLSASLPWPKVNPNHLPNFGQAILKKMLEERINFQKIPAIVEQNPDCPLLMISAVDVMEGRFVTFEEGGRYPEQLERMGEYDQVIRLVNADTILASGTIPTLFPPMRIKDHFYWDGLFSRNPPIRDIAGLQTDVSEIWLIQINPNKYSHVPLSLEEIEDRRNGLTGNLSMVPELFFIEKINQLVANTGINTPKGNGPAKRYRHIDVKAIGLELELDVFSKLDRSPEFIDQLIAYGEKEAERFLRQRKQHSLVDAAVG